MEKSKSKLQLIIIAILIVIFFAILILSTTNKQIEEKYTFKNITLNSLPVDYYADPYNPNVIIGDLNIKNLGFMPVKVKLKNLVLCQISDTYGTNTYTIQYLGKTKTDYGYNEPFGSYYSGYQYVEISSKDEISLDIVPQIYPYTIYDEIIRYDLNNKTLPFYIFEVEEGETNYYNYCNMQRKEDALATIYVTINIPQDELENANKNNPKFN